MVFSGEHAGFSSVSSLCSAAGSYQAAQFSMLLSSFETCSSTEVQNVLVILVNSSSEPVSD